MTREQTIRGMTIWAAKAAFQENELGSLEVGKSADFIILNQDLMTVPETEILNTKVLETWSSGKKVYFFKREFKIGEAKNIVEDAKN